MDGYIGEIRMFAGNFAPQDWAFCQGQTIAISENQSLYSIIGTVYGGNGTTTFALPDLRGRAPIQQGRGPGLSEYQLGQRAGFEETTLLPANLPAHTHDVKCASGAGTVDSPVDAYAADEGHPTFKLYNQTPNATMGATTSTGSSYPISIIQPSLGINYIICTNGLYPSRS